MRPQEDHVKRACTELFSGASTSAPSILLQNMIYIYSARTLIYPKLTASTFTTFSFHCVYIHCHPFFS